MKIYWQIPSWNQRPNTQIHLVGLYFHMKLGKSTMIHMPEY